MRKIEVIDEKIVLTDQIEIVYEQRVTPFGSSAKVGAPKKILAGERIS
ncbi:MAG: DUF2080 family transposase-associated protein [Candidatus Methanofastidiosia archaeon]|jgi:putative transposon-encoded protein